MVVLLFIDDDAEIVRLKLDIIQLRIQLLDLTTIWNAIRLFTKPLDFSFDFPRLRLSIGDTVQFVPPAEYLTVGEGDYLVILSCLCNGERKLPLRLSQAAAMKLENVFLTYYLFSQYRSPHFVFYLIMLIWRKLLFLFYITEPFLAECKPLALNEPFEGFIVI